MGEIVIQCVARWNVGSWAVGWLGNPGPKTKRFSHVDSVMPVWTKYPGQLLGARARRIGTIPSGVQVRPQNYQAFSRRLIIRIPCEDWQERQYYDLMIAEIGKPYDRLAILAFFLDRSWRRDNSWICSELVAHVLEQVKVFRWNLFLDANKIDPVKLIFAVSAVTEVKGG